MRLLPCFNEYCIWQAINHAPITSKLSKITLDTIQLNKFCKMRANALWAYFAQEVVIVRDELISVTDTKNQLLTRLYWLSFQEVTLSTTTPRGTATGSYHDGFVIAIPANTIDSANVGLMLNGFF